MAVKFQQTVSAQVDATLKPGMDVTVCRFWVCDGASHAACESFQWTATPSTRRRRYHAMICNGRSKPAKRPLSGNNGASGAGSWRTAAARTFSRASRTGS